MQKGLVSGLAAETSIEVWGPEKWWEKIIEKVPHVTVAVLCKSTQTPQGEGSTGYQRCGSSDILLLEDNSDEHYTAMCWKD